MALVAISPTPSGEDIHAIFGFQFNRVPFKAIIILSYAVPRGSGAFQMPTCPSSSASSAASTLGGGRANLRNASVSFYFFFLHEASFGMTLTTL